MNIYVVWYLVSTFGVLTKYYAMVDIKKIGDTIRKAREEKKYTQQYLAQQLGMTQKAYCKIENSQTQLTIVHLDKISEVLETPINQLLGTDGAVYNNYATNTGSGDGIVINKTPSEKLSDLYEKMIKTQGDENSFLREQNITLLKTIEALSGKKA